MPVRFVIGRAGSGKTHFLRERLVECVRPDPLNAQVIYLVPKQATFMTQRAIATDARLCGYTGVRIASPDDVAELAMVETGRPAGARLDVAGRSLLIGHLLRQSAGDLEHFSRSAGRPGLAGEIDRAFQEFERSGQSPAEIDHLFESTEEPADASRQQLARKLRDLSKLYGEYQRFLVEHGFDPFERQQTAPEAIDNWPTARDALVLVDDFYDFTVYERQIITALAVAGRQTFIAMMLDPAAPIVAEPNLMPDDLGIFRRTEDAFRRMHFAFKTAKVDIQPPLLLSAPRRWQNAALEAVSHVLDAMPPQPMQPDAAVRLRLANDARDEAEIAAREVGRLLYQGYRLRDICVLARSADKFAAQIEAAFTEHEIPYFIDRRRPAAHHPLVRTIQAIGQIVQTRWSHDGVFDLLKAGLTLVTPRTVDLLADYVAQHRLTASAWAREQVWDFNRRDEEEHKKLFSAEEMDSVNAAAALVRSAIGPLASPRDIDQPKKIGNRVCDLLAALDRLDLRDAMSERIKRFEDGGEVERREEEEQVWSRWAELSDRLHELLGDVEVTGTDFFKLLQTSLDDLDLAVVPPTLDQVLVGSVDRTRVGEPKAVVLIGLNACDFPLCQQERPILNDADRVRLLDAGLELEAPTRQALLMERFLGYIALTRASEKLVLIRTACDEHGQDCASSPFWDAVEKLFPGQKPEKPPMGLKRIATPAQLVSHLLIWARRQRETIEPSDDAALYQWLVTAEDDRIAAVRNLAWPSLTHANAAALLPAVAAKLFTSPLEASVSRFESFAACPFQHFARYGLRLQRPMASEFTAMDLGNLYHAVLDDLVAGTIRRKVNFPDAGGLSPDDIRGVSRRLAETIADQLFLSDARSRFTLEQLDRTVHKLIRSQQVAAGIGQMRPAFTELTFGQGVGLPAVEFDTPRGHAVRLRGKIDRVDTNAERSVFSVVDYKLTGDALDYGYVTHGLMLQLLTYLLVLREHGPTLFERGAPLPPAAALYVKVLRGVRSVGHPSEAPEPDTEPFHLKEKPRGVIARSHATYLDPDIAAGVQSKVVSYRLKQDGDFAATGQDGVDDAVLADLIDYVRTQIAELADNIIAGDVAVSPYMIAKETACQRCDLRRVCRFDRAINSYRQLTPLGRQQAIDAIRGPKGGDRGH